MRYEFFRALSALRFKSALSAYEPTMPPTVENAEEDIDTVHPPLNIGTGPFTLDEYRKAKSSIKEGKAWGDDNIAPEVLKQCDLNQIVLDFCNNALLKGEKPDQ